MTRRIPSILSYILLWSQGSTLHCNLVIPYGVLGLTKPYLAIRISRQVTALSCELWCKMRFPAPPLPALLLENAQGNPKCLDDGKLNFKCGFSKFQYHPGCDICFPTACGYPKISSLSLLIETKRKEFIMNDGTSLQ